MVPFSSINNSIAHFHQSLFNALMAVLFYSTHEIPIPLKRRPLRIVHRMEKPLAPPLPLSFNVQSVLYLFLLTETDPSNASRPQFESCQILPVLLLERRSSVLTYSALRLCPLSVNQLNLTL